MSVDVLACPECGSKPTTAERRAACQDIAQGLHSFLRDEGLVTSEQDNVPFHTASTEWRNKLIAAVQKGTQ